MGAAPTFSEAQLSLKFVGLKQFVLLDFNILFPWFGQSILSFLCEHTIPQGFHVCVRWVTFADFPIFLCKVGTRQKYRRLSLLLGLLYFATLPLFNILLTGAIHLNDNCAVPC